MRRLGAFLVLLSLLAAACDDGDGSAAPPGRRPDPVGNGRAQPTPGEGLATPEAAPTPTPGRILPVTEASWATGLPALIVANGSEVNRYRRGAPTRIGTLEGEAHVAFAAGAGTVIAQHVQDKRSELVRLRRGRNVQRIDTGAAYASLLDVATIDGARRMLFSTYHAPAGERGDTAGYLYLENLSGGDRRRLTESDGPEFGITHASYGGGTIVASAWSDLTERFLFLRPDGDEITDRLNPTEDLPYGNPPYMSDAVLSPDGRLMAYLEGPDWNQLEQAQTGDWVAVILDQQTNRERLRVHVADGDQCVPRLDFDGRWLVVSRAKWDERDGALVCEPSAVRSLPVSVIDTSADEQQIVVIVDVKGIATIDD
ncbi:MAG: hypothetical protein ACRDKJ_03510 [Actinomycetota bacterium]